MTVFRFLPQKSEGIAAEAMEAEYLHSISRFYIDVRINDLKKEKKRGKCFGCRRHDCNECRAGCVMKTRIPLFKFCACVYVYILRGKYFKKIV